MRFRDGAAVLLLSLALVISLPAQSTNIKPALSPQHPCQGDPDYRRHR